MNQKDATIEYLANMMVWYVENDMYQTAMLFQAIIFVLKKIDREEVNNENDEQQSILKFI